MEFIKRNPKIFIVSGKARSGKGTIANMITNYYKDKKCITTSFGYYIKDYAKRVSDWNGFEDTKPRELLQQLGIELIKNKINNRLFINRIIEDIEIFSYFYDIIIIDDARLLDEIESLKNKYPKSISIRVKRDNDNNLTSSEKKHLTEIDLDNYNNFDYIVNNDSNLESLENKIYNILGEV